jgi:hypothetical protein
MTAPGRAAVVPGAAGGGVPKGTTPMSSGNGKASFRLSIPLWTVANIALLKKHGDLVFAIPRMNSVEWGPFVPLFSTAALAQRPNPNLVL